MSIKILALAIKSTALASEAMLTIILSGAVATVASGAGRPTDLPSPGGGRRIGPPSPSAARRAGPSYQPVRSRCRTSPPGARPAPMRAHTVADGRTFQLG
jgi:hypothetical protein